MLRSGRRVCQRRFDMSRFRRVDSIDHRTSAGSASAASIRSARATADFTVGLWGKSPRRPIRRFLPVVSWDYRTRGCEWSEVKRCEVNCRANVSGSLGGHGIGA